MSTLGYDALIAAGATHLPEGYFYRVKHPTALGTITVQLRQRRRYGSRLLEEITQWLPLRGRDPHSAASFVADICSALAKRHQWEEDWGQKFDREIRDLVGDHP